MLHAVALRVIRPHFLAGALVALALVAGLATLLSGAGSSSAPARNVTSAPITPRVTPSAPAARPRAASHAGARTTPVRSRIPAPRLLAAHHVPQQPDPYAAQSFPAPASVHHAAAVTPASAGAMVAPGAPSDVQVQQELTQMQAATSAAQASVRGGSIGGAGTVTPPTGVPAVVARVIAGANAIATFPYVYGGGHGSFVDSAYDCSGSVSYALAAGGLLSTPLTSGDLESWGVPGPGRWITVEANAGHTYMYIDGVRFDTAGRSGVFGSRWQTGQRTNAGFVVRHWPGL